MNPSRRHGRDVSAWLTALAILLAIGMVGRPAPAAETGVGSKNFTAPTYVPNYFSNETGFTGGRAAPPGTAPVYAAPSPAARSAYGYATASNRSGRYRRYAVSRRTYYHRAQGRTGARRHLVSVVARGRRQSSHTRPAAAHLRAVHSHSRVARAGR